MMEGCHPELQTATLPILKLVTLQPWKAWREHYTIRKGSCLHLSAVFCLKIQRSSKWKLLQVTELKQKGLLADGLATKHFIILGSDTHSVDTFSRKHMQKKERKKISVYLNIRKLRNVDLIYSLRSQSSLYKKSHDEVSSSEINDSTLNEFRSPVTSSAS